MPAVVGVGAQTGSSLEPRSHVHVLWPIYPCPALWILLCIYKFVVTMPRLYGAVGFHVAFECF